MFEISESAASAAKTSSMYSKITMVRVRMMIIMMIIMMMMMMMMMMMTIGNLNVKGLKS